MSHQVEASVVVLNGLTLTARGSRCPAEPDVGIMHPYFEDIELLWPKTGKPVPQKMYDRVTEDEWDRAQEELMSASYYPEGDY